MSEGMEQQQLQHILKRNYYFSISEEDLMMLRLKDTTYIELKKPIYQNVVAVKYLIKIGFYELAFSKKRMINHPPSANLSNGRDLFKPRYQLTCVNEFVCKHNTHPCFFDRLDWFYIHNDLIYRSPWGRRY